MGAGKGERGAQEIRTRKIGCSCGMRPVLGGKKVGVCTTKRHGWYVIMIGIG